MLGKSVTRKAKLVYEHTPEWPYFDLRKQAEFTGWESSSFHLELAAVPEVCENDGTEAAAEWFETHEIARNGVLSEEMWDALLDAVDEKCKAEDAKRRRAAGLGKLRPPTTRSN